MKGLPLSYFKDMQDDKKIVFECYNNLSNNLKLTSNLVKSMKPKKKKCIIIALKVSQQPQILPSTL